MADHARRLKALEALSQPLMSAEVSAAERRLADAEDISARERGDKWTCDLLRLRQNGLTMLEAMRQAKIEDVPDYPRKAEDEALVKRHREATGWMPPLAEHTEERAAEILEDIYQNVLRRIGANND